LTTDSPRTGDTATRAPAPRQGWTFGRIGIAVSGGAVAIVGILLAVGGAAVIAAHAFARDDDGFYSSGTDRFETDGYAIETENIDLGTPADTAPDKLLGTVRVRGESAGSKPVFIAIAPRDRIDAYLDGVSHSVLTDIDDPEYDDVAGGRPAGPPTKQEFWSAEASGSGEQTMEWDVEGGDWSVVFMNADGSRPVALDAGVAIDLDWLIWVGIGLLVIGIAMAAGGVALIVIMRREANRSWVGPAAPGSRVT
jgi:hypothetical protein